jgi:two-component sensor histidine kinase
VVDRVSRAARWDENERVAVLKSYGILDTPPEPELDNIARLAAQVCETSFALITLVDDRRQWFKSEIGLGIRETPLGPSICAKAILQPGLFTVPDTTKDRRFRFNPLVVGGPRLRFYAGVRLETPAGLPLGTLCVLDAMPRMLTKPQEFALTTLAEQVMAQFELRRALAEREEALATVQQSEARQALLVRELHHRVGNTLAMVQALVSTIARSAKSVPELSRAVAARIASLARNQKLLTEDYWQTASLGEMVDHELRPFLHSHGERVVRKGDPLHLSADLAIPVGMALHELTSNAVKHGALSVAEGWLAVTWDVRVVDGKRKLHLAWTEHDGPLISEPQRTGFGSTLLNRVLALQANATVQIAYDRDGFRFEMEAPLIEKRLVPHY